MIRLQLVIPTLDRSGAEKQFALLATGLPRDEFRVEVVALTRGGPYAENIRQAGLPLTILKKRWRFDPPALRRLRRHLRERRPDIVHTWLFAANAYGRLAVGSGAERPKLIVSERCVDVWKSRWQLWLDRRLIARTDRLIANAECVAEFYRGLGYPADRVSVIHNGVETPVPGVRAADSIREEFGIARGTRLIGYVGRLAPQKRLTDLIWAMELLRHLDHPVCLLIIGDGPQRSELEQFAREIRVDELIRFAGHRLDAASLIPHLDVFWLASDFEGQSNSLMEAMAAGVPVVVSDIAPNRELVTHIETGLVVPVGDKAGFAKATGQLLSDPDLAERLALAARLRMQRDFSIAQMIDGHVALYREIHGQGIRNRNGLRE